MNNQACGAAATFHRICIMDSWSVRGSQSDTPQQFEREKHCQTAHPLGAETTASHKQTRYVTLQTESPGEPRPDILSCLGPPRWLGVHAL